MSVSNHSHRLAQVWRGLMLPSDFGLLGVFSEIMRHLDLGSFKIVVKIFGTSSLQVLGIVACVNTHSLSPLMYIAP